MASIIDEGNGRKRIRFSDHDGKRKGVRLGKASTKQAESARTHIEALLTAVIQKNSPPEETSHWVASLGDMLHDRLSRAGLAAARIATELGKFLDAYIAGRTDTKPRTVINLKRARKALVDFFGEGKPLKAISEGDAEDFWRWLLAAGLHANTARRICGRAKQFCHYAIRKRLLTSNPFAALKCQVQGNPDREYFVSRADAQKVIDACNDPQWRLLFALSRYGGLRCPSEHLSLKWADVDWEKNRVKITSPKTEHHEGKDHRFIPMFPELRPYLLEVFEEAEPGTEYVITRYRDSNTNLRTQLLRIISRAGLKPWPKLFHNLRSTRETELAETWPIHIVCNWIGNSEAVAKKHYLQVTDEHFAAAALPEQGSVNDKAGQNPGQHGAETAGTGPQSKSGNPQKTLVLQGLSSQCKNMQSEGIPPPGLEPGTAV